MNPGPFFFAWVEEGTPWGESLMRVDESILDFNFSQSEGDFATLDIEIENPRVGLLAMGRPRWAWFAVNPNWNPDAPDQVSESESEVSEPFEDVVPLFYGRIVGVPDDMDGETVRLSFVARPVDFAEQKAALAETLKVAPYWDSIWFSPESVADPDNVLESRPELWHIDPVTHIVSVSNIINGEDGTIALNEDNVFYDSVSVSPGEAALRQVNITASVSWSQIASGAIDISRALAHPADAVYNSGAIVTYTGDGLPDAWPKAGTGFNGGWSCQKSSIARVDSTIGALWGYSFDTPSVNAELAKKWILARPPDSINFNVPYYAKSWGILGFGVPGRTFYLPRMRFYQQTFAQYDANRSKSETVVLQIKADVQSVVTDPEDTDVLDLSFSSSEVSNPDPDGVIPIGSQVKRSYFNQERGVQSIEYLIALGRSRLLAAARTVDVSVETPFREGVLAGITLRKNAHLIDARLPGGQAAGKVKSYSITGNGDSGRLECSLTFGCTIGKGGTVEPIAGDPTYSSAGYMSAGYQRMENEFVMPIAGEILYASILGSTASIDDDGYDFERMTPTAARPVVIRSGEWPAQRAAVLAIAPTIKEPKEIYDVLATMPCTWSLTLKPVDGGPFASTWNIPTSELKIPKTIDLEASS